MGLIGSNEARDLVFVPLLLLAPIAIGSVFVESELLVYFRLLASDGNLNALIFFEEVVEAPIILILQ